MKSWKFKILFPAILISILVGAKFILWDYAISEGKRVGNLTKISHKGKLLKTWEGTIDEGSGDKLTSFFSVSDNSIGEELNSYEGRRVVLRYKEYLMGWPRETKYDVFEWTPKAEAEDVVAQVQANVANSSAPNNLVEYIGKTLFCSMLGTLYKDKTLYNQVKEFIKKENLYLYKQYEKCNE